MIVAANIVLCTCSTAAYLNKFLHCMYYAQMYAAYFAEIILQRPIGLVSALYWTWLVRVLSGLIPACLSVCPGSECCLCVVSTSCDNPFLSLESFVITELMITELSVKFAKLQNSEYEYGLDHVGGTRCCESNKSHFVLLRGVYCYRFFC